MFSPFVCMFNIVFVCANCHELYSYFFGLYCVVCDVDSWIDHLWLISDQSFIFFAYNIVLTNSIIRVCVSSLPSWFVSSHILLNERVFHSSSTNLSGCSSNLICFYCLFISSSVGFFNVEPNMLLLFLHVISLFIFIFFSIIFPLVMNLQFLKIR